MGAGDSKAEGGKRATPLLAAAAAAAADDDEEEEEEEEEEVVVEGEGGESGADVAERDFDVDFDEAFDDEALRFNDLKSSGVFKTLP